MVASHNTAFDCIDHFSGVIKKIDEFAEPTIPFIEYKVTWGKDAINYVANNKIERLEELEKKLTQDIREKIYFIEN